MLLVKVVKVNVVKNTVGARERLSSTLREGFWGMCATTEEILS